MQSGYRVLGESRQFFGQVSSAFSASSPVCFTRVKHLLLNQRAHRYQTTTPELGFIEQG